MRAATADDAAAIARVQVRTWRTDYHGIVPDVLLEATVADSARIARWRAILDAQVPSTAFVATVGGRVIGFAAGGAGRGADEGSGGQLTSLYVLPAWQRRGVGEALLRATADALSRQGFRSMKVWTLAAGRSVGFYQRLGGVGCDGRRRARGADGPILDEVAYTFRLPLASSWPRRS